MGELAAAGRKTAALPVPRETARPPGRSLRHLLLEQRTQAAQPLQRAVARGYPVQLRLTTKEGKHGAKIDGPIESMVALVGATIRSNDLGDMANDIAALQISIKSREKEQTEFDPGTQAYKDHQHRIHKEQEQLARLVTARDVERARRRADTQRDASADRRADPPADPEKWRTNVGRRRRS